MLSIDRLLVTQQKIRNLDQVVEMIEYVRKGGLFTLDALEQHKSRGRVSPLIEVTEFTDDGAMYLHDGHHRVVSIALGGRDYLAEGEYRIRTYKYADYTKANLNAHWFTPFDPRTELRLSDMTDYKRLIQELTEVSTSEEEILSFIETNKNLYSEPRSNIVTLMDFAASTGSNLFVVE